MYMTERLFLVSHPSIHSILSYPLIPYFHLVGCLYYQKCLGRWILTLISFSSTPCHFTIPAYLPHGRRK
ncbi:hypothetical protein ASPFODRAFT_588898 [Aspergillus luchuensis CBS 106.47]|uniref:Uncharacterized protein n=1 Tax=Aspergillus luchuensis (strain CBS 106.47) TaxID=1137211 RepID=A0A1M3TLW2_ASPLC|nr:hypothetical protein ASPFODRAFT_588898 [Aspergillus luchuensis CBS 106.47]